MMKILFLVKFFSFFILFFQVYDFGDEDDEFFSSLQMMNMMKGVMNANVCPQNLIKMIYYVTTEGELTNQNVTIELDYLCET